MQLPSTISKALDDVHDAIGAGQAREEISRVAASELRLNVAKLVNACKSTLDAQENLLHRVNELLKSELDRRQAVNEMAAKLAEGSENTCELVNVLQAEAWRKAKEPSFN